MPDYRHATDEELIASSAQNQLAFAEIVHRYEAKLLRYIHRLGIRQAEDTEDILQNTFIKVYRNLHSFDPKLSFSSWIYRITHNEVVSFFRKRKVRPQGHYVDDAEKIMERIANGDSASKLAEQNFDAEILGQALAKISRKYQNVIVLRYFEEREYQEISDILKVPVGSVGTMLHRAKKALKKELDHLTVES